MSETANTIVIKAVGDVCLDGIASDPFMHVAGALEADLLFCNLECTFAARGTAASKNVTFKADAASADHLARHRFNLVNMANNHVLDYGPEGLEDTLKALGARGLRFFGAGRSAYEAEAPLRFEHRGVRTAVLAAADASGGGSDGPTISVSNMRALRRRVAEIRPEATTASTAPKEGSKVGVMEFHQMTVSMTCAVPPSGMASSAPSNASEAATMRPSSAT